MDNTMTAVISSIMMGLGFICGMFVSSLIDMEDMAKLQLRVAIVKTENAKLSAEVNYLNTELDKERLEKEDLVKKLEDLVRPYIRLPPPTGPLERCEGCSDTDSEDEFDCPISPDPVSYNKD